MKLTAEKLFRMLAHEVIALIRAMARRDKSEHEEKSKVKNQEWNAAHPDYYGTAGQGRPNASNRRKARQKARNGYNPDN